MDGGTKLGSEMAIKRYFSGLERRHTGEPLDEMRVSIANAGGLPIRQLFENWKREFRDW